MPVGDADRIRQHLVHRVNGARQAGKAMVTLVQVRRSAPIPPGARLCVTRNGRMSGSVSGGCVEAIKDPCIRDAIVQTVGGGNESFRLRQLKHGI